MTQPGRAEGPRRGERGGGVGAAPGVVAGAAPGAAEGARPGPRRHYGDPGREYRAAVQGCGVVWRGDRRLLRVYGRAPAQMLNGILTCRVPEPPVGVGVGVAGGEPGEGAAGARGAKPGEGLAGDAVYGTILTAKGRMVTDLTTLWLGAGGEEGLGLSVAACGVEAVLGHFNRFLPPRMARVEDLGDRTGLLTVLGPEAGDVVAAAFGAAPAEGFVLVGGGPSGGPDAGGAHGALVARGVEQVASWDVWLPADGMEAAWERLGQAGALPVGEGVWHTLRVEAGYPAYGADMDESTIPVEAGLLDRAFDHGKGCYTGQEVIVRIRHRGRVNWHLRALRFGEAAARPGDELFETGGGKARGRVTSVAQSPRFGQAIGLGYVRREVEPPATLRLGSGSGPAVGVELAERSSVGSRP